MRIGIAQEAYFFEKLGSEQMIFVDKQHSCAFGLLGIKQHLVQRGQTAWLTCGSATDLELIQHHFKEFVAGKNRVEKKRALDRHFTVRNNLQRGMDECRFPGADGPRKHQKTFSIENSLEHGC